MITKTRKFWVTAVAILTAVFLVGCGNLTGVQVEGSKANGTLSLDATITNYSDFVKDDGAARTIFPEERPGEAKIALYLSGQIVDSTTKFNEGKPKKVNVTSKSFTETQLTPGIWEFTLYAVAFTDIATAPTEYASDAEAKAAAMLWGYAYVDMTTKNGNASFKLISDGLDGTGDVDITCFLSNDLGSSTWYDDLVAAYPTPSFTVTIHNYITDALIPSQTYADTTLPWVDGSDKKKGMKPAIANLAPGTYNLVFTISTTVGSEEIVIERISETIVVMTNRKTIGNVYIPNLIRQKPEDVKALTAVYIKNSEDEVNHIGEYKVQFDWTNMVNVDYYELQIADITKVSSANIASYKAAWPTSLTNVTVSYYTPSGKVYVDDSDVSTLASGYTEKALRGVPEYVDGSLARGNKTATLYLELGKRYTARIRAVNEMGPSTNWTHVTLTENSNATNTTLETLYETYTTAYNEATTDAQKTAAEDAFKNGLPTAIVADEAVGAAFFDSSDTPAIAKVINRFRITYHPNGGSYEKVAGTSIKSDYIKYYCEQAEAPASPALPGYAYWDGNPDGVVVTALKSGDKNLNKWVAEGWLNATLALQDGFVVWSSDSLHGKYQAKYAQSENHEVWANYSSSSYSFTGKYDYETDLSKYKFFAENVKLGGTAITDNSETDSAHKVYGGPGETSLPSSLAFSLTIPTDNLPLKEGSTTVYEMYDKIRITVHSLKEDKDVFVKTTTEALTAGSPITFNVPTTSWNGGYIVTFTATKKVGSKTVVRDVYLTIRVTR